MKKSSFAVDYKIKLRKSAIKRALMSPEERLRIERKAHREYLWTQRLYSTDLEVMKELFQKEWKEIEKCFDNDADRLRLKEMFDIK